MMRVSTSIPAVIAACLFTLPAANAGTPIKTTRVAAGYNLPVFVCAPKGDRNRLFVVEQRGSAGVATRGDVRILNLNTLATNAVPFLSVTGLNTGNEEGFLGFAFHPRYGIPGDPNRGAIFAYYTTGGNNRVVRFNVPDATPDVADSASGQLIINFSHPGASNHNGGWIGFGPDGYLYIATGDGGGGCDSAGNAQNINSLLGKMHRLDVDTDQFPGSSTDWGYAIPPTNPFAGATPGADEIFHYGLRNPFRNSFDRERGDMYIGDVGQNSFEEISFARLGDVGLNFGWDVYEGNACSSASGCTSICTNCAPACVAAFTFTFPLHTYSLAGTPCAVTGGYVYRGAAMCDLRGTYFFADYCSAQIWSMPAGGGTVTLEALSPSDNGFNVNSITSFGEDAWGEIYIVDQGGEIFKIIPNGVDIVGDMNGDKVYTIADGDLLALALVDPAAYSALFPAINASVVGDTNCDGFFDGRDVDGMVKRILP